MNEVECLCITHNYAFNRSKTALTTRLLRFDYPNYSKDCIDMGMSLQLSFEVGLLDVIVGIHGSVCERLVHVTEVGELESGGRDKVASEDVLRKSPEG